jgi:hypothetical protein
MPINVLASEKTNATEVTADKVIKLLNYCNMHPETKIRYHASAMILHIHSDASYLSENEAKSRAGFFKHGQQQQRRKKNYQRGKFDHQQGSQTCDVVSSRGRNWSSFHKRQRRSSHQENIRRIGAHTAPVPMETDNTTATGNSNATIKQKRTKTMDMHSYWIKDRVKQGQFNVYWGP